MVCGHVSYHLPAAFFLLAVFRSHVSDLCNPPLHPRYFAWPIQFSDADSGTVLLSPFPGLIQQSCWVPDCWYNPWSHRLLPSFSFPEGSFATVWYYLPASCCAHLIPRTAAVFPLNRWLLNRHWPVSISAVLPPARQKVPALFSCIVPVFLQDSFCRLLLPESLPANLQYRCSVSWLLPGRYPSADAPVPFLMPEFQITAQSASADLLFFLWSGGKNPAVH